MSEEVGRAEDDITEITLSSGLDDDAHLKPEHVNIVFVQEQKFKGVKRTYYTQKSFSHKDNTRHRVNLNYVNIKPERECKVAWSWLSTAFATIVWSMLLFYVGLFTQYKADYIVIVGVLLGTFSMISMLIFYYRTHDKLIFCSHVGKIPLFEVSNHKPGNKEFDAFMETLRQHIKVAQDKLSMHQRLVGELKDLRRIRDEGRISNESYESARNTIFRHEAFQIKQGS